MTESLFFRLLKAEEKDERLREAIQSLRSSPPKPPVHPVAQDTFRMIPGAPFAYWVSDAMRRKFTEFRQLGDSAAVQRGLFTGDDFRWLRLTWETPPGPSSWRLLSKGGEFSPYYADPHLVIEHADGFAALKLALLSRYPYLLPRADKGHKALDSCTPKEINAAASWALHPESSYFAAGLTWPRRTQAGFAARYLPAGCFFSEKSSCIFPSDVSHLDSLLGIVNSAAARMCIELQMAFGSYEVGVVQRVPIPLPDDDTRGSLARLARSIHDGKRSVDTADENSHASVLPALARRSAAPLQAELDAWNVTIAQAGEIIVKAQREIDEICHQLYGISAEDRATIEAELGTEVRGLPEPLTGTQAAADLVSWIVGVVLGRFDLRLATGERAIPDPPDPFEPLPAYSAGMLPEGRVPAGYPIAVDEDGILVDDESHSDDVVARVREILHLLWKDQADAIEKEACGLLGVKSLRDYFGRMGKGGFWDDHCRRYTRSRRRAPILWPLQSPRGLVRVWVYAHRLTKDTLPKVLGPRYLGGMLARAKHGIEELRPGGQTKPGLAKKEEKRLADLDERVVDLEEFAAMIRAAVERTNDRGETVGYVPDLNDGVVLAAAPLHEMMPWPKTRKHRGQTVSDLRAYWEELAEGEYDWAHAAMLYWPTRVREKCRQDKSLAIAHGLDTELFPGLREELRRQAEAASDSTGVSEGEDEQFGDEEGEE